MTTCGQTFCLFLLSPHSPFCRHNVTSWTMGLRRFCYEKSFKYIHTGIIELIYFPNYFLVKRQISNTGLFLANPILTNYDNFMLTLVFERKGTKWQITFDSFQILFCFWMIMIDDRHFYCFEHNSTYLRFYQIKN